MVRWVTFMVCLLLVVDVLVVGGVGDKEKKRSGAGDKSATGEKKPKKQRLAGEAEDRLTREDIMDTILPEVGVQMDSQFLQFEQPYSSSGICVSDDYGLDAEDADDEARIDTFMHNLETGGDTASAGQHTVRFANTNTEPLRLRLRQLRSGDVTAVDASYTNTMTTWSTQQGNRRRPGEREENIPALPTTSSTVSHSDTDGSLAALSRRVETLQEMMEQVIAVVTPMVHENIQARNQRLGPDVRLRTNAPAVLTDALQQLPTTIAQTAGTTTQPQQTRTADRLQQIRLKYKFYSSNNRPCRRNNLRNRRDWPRKIDGHLRFRA